MQSLKTLIFATVTIALSATIIVFSAVIVVGFAFNTTEGPPAAACWSFLVAVGFALAASGLYQLTRLADAVTARRGAPSTPRTNSADHTANRQTPRP